MTSLPHRLIAAGGHLIAYSSIAVVSIGMYIILALAQNGEFGWPLDDAWIHQVFARNLGTLGEFAFFTGQPSAGSTSPLWTLLLAGGYAVNIDFRVWTIGLGFLLLVLTAILAARIAQRLGANPFTARWLVPVYVLTEWHLVWAAVSGMEILLFIALSLLLTELFLAEQDPLWVGAVAGLLTVTRPEGAILALMVVAGYGLRVRGAGLPFLPLLIQLRAFTITFAIVIAPYVLFNLFTSGALLPNTFYAKSQEYAGLLTGTNFFVRWLSLYRQPLIGAQILLVPGVLWMGWKLMVSRQFELAIPLLWILTLPALYAARLPVDYQFGRYEMPIIPFVGIYGVVGTASALQNIPIRVFRRAWVASTAVLAFAFLWIGANLNAQAVGIINCEMVATARWSAVNVPRGEWIAVHDIGAQGYFDAHPLLDLAGLVSPEVIPFIRDETRINAWMHARGATYAIFFPDWYPQLAHARDLTQVHSENCEATHAAGGVDLGVYQLAR